jgi:hypothetical protein
MSAKWRSPTPPDLLELNQPKGVHVMINVPSVVANYMAVWNENDPDERRRRIQAAWAPDGATCNRMIDAHGYEAIEARVIGSWDKWLREGKYIFRSKSIAHHHDVIKFDWVMTQVPSGEVEASGLSFLLLDSDGRIAYDYQFNPSANDAEDLAERYLAMWNETDAAARRRRVGELFAPDGVHVSEASTAKGHAGIEAEAGAAQAAYIAKGFLFSPAGCSQAHHNVARFQWRMRRSEGDDLAVGSNLIVLDDQGRIRFDYQFEEAA